MDDVQLATELGHIKGVLEGIATTQNAMRQDMATHMDKEERTLAEYDKRMRRMETKVHTTWIIGGGAVVALFTILEARIKAMLGIH